MTLRILNIGLGLLHLASAAVILVLGLQFLVPTTYIHVYYRNLHRVFEIGSFDVLGAISAYLFLTALFHFGNVWTWPQFDRDGYAKWIEYFFTAPLMLLVLAVITGTTEVTTLVALWGLMATTLVFGLLQEGRNNQERRLLIYLGMIPYLFAWAVIFLQFGYTAQVQTFPIYAPVAIFVQFVLFGSFAALPLLGMKYPGISRREEYFYPFLSLVSKLFQAWLLFGGVKNIPP